MASESRLFHMAQLDKSKEAAGTESSGCTLARKLSWLKRHPRRPYLSADGESVPA
jgi:hypothetical protein